MCIPQRLLSFGKQKVIFSWINFIVLVLILASMTGKKISWTVLEQEFDVVLYSLNSTTTTVPGRFLARLGISEGERCINDGDGHLNCGEAEDLDVYGCEDAGKSVLTLMTFALVAQLVGMMSMITNNAIGINSKMLKLFLLLSLGVTTGFISIALSVWNTDCHSDFKETTISALNMISVNIIPEEPTASYGHGFMLAVSAVVIKASTVLLFWGASSKKYQPLKKAA